MDLKFNQKVLTLEMQIQELSLQKYLLPILLQEKDKPKWKEENY